MQYQEEKRMGRLSAEVDRITPHRHLSPSDAGSTLTLISGHKTFPRGLSSFHLLAPGCIVGVEISYNPPSAVLWASPPPVLPSGFYFLLLWAKPQMPQRLTGKWPTSRWHWNISGPRLMSSPRHSVDAVQLSTPCCISPLFPWGWGMPSLPPILPVLWVFLGLTEHGLPQVCRGRGGGHLHLNDTYRGVRPFPLFSGL